ncbi:MAG: hypothetical protein GY719_25815 [bacterium]|nr:hypothetical protein [bacterium]
MFLLAAILTLALAGLALIAWALASVAGWWAWPLAAGIACLVAAVLIPGRDAWRLWWAEGLRKRFE